MTALISNRAHRLAVGAFFFVAGLSFASWASRIPDIKSHLHLNDAALGGVLFALPVGSMVSLGLSGWMITKFGSKIAGCDVWQNALVKPRAAAKLGLPHGTYACPSPIYFLPSKSFPR